MAEISPLTAHMEPQSRGWRAITMAPSESYQHVVKGGLKFKGGGGLPTAGGVKRRRKRTRRCARPPLPSLAALAIPPENFTPLARHDPHAQRDAESPSSSPRAANGEKKLSEPKDNRTEAERRYDEQAERTQARLIEKMASKSHKDKVREFSEYLSEAQRSTTTYQRSARVDECASRGSAHVAIARGGSTVDY